MWYLVDQQIHAAAAGRRGWMPECVRHRGREPTADCDSTAGRRTIESDTESELREGNSRILCKVAKLNKFYNHVLSRIRRDASLPQRNVPATPNAHNARACAQAVVQCT